MANVKSMWSLLDGINPDDRAALDFFWKEQGRDLLGVLRAEIRGQVRQARLYWKLKHRPRVELSYAEVRAVVLRYERITAWELATVRVKGRTVGLRDACECLYRMVEDGLTLVCGHDDREGDIFHIKLKSASTPNLIRL